MTYLGQYIVKHFNNLVDRYFYPENESQIILPIIHEDDVDNQKNIVP